MGVRQRLRNQTNPTYTPATSGEVAAHEMWMEAAAEGGFYWAAMVGLHTQTHGLSALNEVCVCAGATKGVTPPYKHIGHAALRAEAVRDVFEKTLVRRLSRARRWIMRHSIVRR